MTDQLPQLELRQQLLTERFGPVAALVLERALTASTRYKISQAGRHRPPGCRIGLVASRLPGAVPSGGGTDPATPDYAAPEDAT